MIKRYRQFFLWLCCMAPVLVAYSAPASLNAVAAIVNNDIITSAQLNQQMNIAQQQFLAAGKTPPKTEVLKKQVLNQLIDTKLQLQIAQKANITVADNQVNQAIAEIAARNNISVAQLQTGIAQQGLSFSTYREEIRKEMIISQLQQREIAPQVKVSEQEIKDMMYRLKKSPQYMNTVTLPQTITQAHVRMILIKNNPLLSPEAMQAHLQLLRSQIIESGDFASLAQLNSQDANTASKGGDFGWVSADMLPPQVGAAMGQLKVGEISQPIITNNGAYILQVLARRQMPLGKNSLEDRARLIVYQRNYAQALQYWLQALRSQSYIKIND